MDFLLKIVYSAAKTGIILLNIVKKEILSNGDEIKLVQKQIWEYYICTVHYKQQIDQINQDL